MFGNLIASANYLTPQELKRYKSCYCGLCRCLKESYGQASRLLLNYDMTFLILLLQSLYEPNEESGFFYCPLHPKEQKVYELSEITNYSADMLIALSYYKFIDNWKDDKSLISLSAANYLKNKVLYLKDKYPEQLQAIEVGINNLNEIEKSNSDDADNAAGSFGHILANIFLYKNDRWHDTLYTLGDNLGRFVYLLDAALDLNKDVISNSYNPFRKYYGLDNAERFRDILKLFLSEAIVSFDSLPLVQDVGILKNILCSGIWVSFEEKYGSIQGSRLKP